MYQKVQIIGNLGRDPEMKYLDSGKCVTNFSVATESFGENKKTTWFNVSAWEKLAENCNQFLHKGSKVYVEGSLHEGTPNVWLKEGVPQASYEINARVVLFLSPKSESDPINVIPTGADIPF
jgi:single-strand DNA-binding protein